jgi:hypothetical protein
MPPKRLKIALPPRNKEFENASVSALGQKRTLAHVRVMSALPPKADIADPMRNVRFVPKADICSAAEERPFDHDSRREL